MPLHSPVAVLFVAALAALPQPAGAQATKQEPPTPAAQQPFPELVERWLTTDQSDRDELDKTVLAILKEQKAGIAWLGQQLTSAAAKPPDARSKSIQTLTSHAVLEVLRRTRATDIVFVGQYDTLAPLQPFAGELLFTWLLATPDWYPHTHRIRLVAPLRDLQKQPPDEDRLEAVERLAANAEEPENLRRATAAMLWQWGHKQHGQRIVGALTAEAAEGDAEDRVQATLELADFHVLLREYKQAANAHRSAQTLAKGAGVTLRPIAWYAAACVHALLGDVERGIAALEECAKLQDTPDLDPSLRMAKTMFDSDPELAALRKHPRWNELVQRACAHAPEKVETGRTGR